MKVLSADLPRSAIVETSYQADVYCHGYTKPASDRNLFKCRVAERERNLRLHSSQTSPGAHTHTHTNTQTHIHIHTTELTQDISTHTYKQYHKRRPIHQHHPNTQEKGKRGEGYGEEEERVRGGLGRGGGERQEDRGKGGGETKEKGGRGRTGERPRWRSRGMRKWEVVSLTKG